MKALFLALLLFALRANAQDSTAPAFRFNHLALSVQDLDRSAAFYGGLLQLAEITNRTQAPGIRWFAVGGGAELHLISTLKQPVTVNKAVHLALATPAFNAFVRRLRSRGVQFSDWPGNPGQTTTRADGVKQLYLQDPDGYWIEVNSVAGR